MGLMYHDPFSLEVFDIDRCWSGHCDCGVAVLLFSIGLLVFRAVIWCDVMLISTLSGVSQGQLGIRTALQQDREGLKYLPASFAQL